MPRARSRPVLNSSSSAGFATGVDVTLALLFPLTWVSPNLIHGSLFELLAACLAAELLVLLVLFTATKRHIADTREAFRLDWTIARGVVLLVVGYQVLAEDLGWPVLAFIAATLLAADFPLRIASHADWRKQLNVDVWIVLGIVMTATLLTIFLRFPPVPYVHVPPLGFVHDLVTKYNVPPQEIFALGTLYFVPKAILNSWRLFSSPTEEDLIEAYRKTRYTVADQEWRFVMTVGARCPELQRCHAHFGAASSLFITAWNPGSVRRADAKNEEDQSWLLGEMQRSGYAILKGSGEDPSGKWPGEPSLLVLGIEEGAARLLGRRCGQKAVVFAGQDAIPRLLLLERREFGDGQFNG